MIGLLRAGERVVGVRVEDVETGERVSRSAPGGRQLHRGVDRRHPGRWPAGAASFHVRASKGVHLVVPRDRINSETGLILRTEKSVLFVIPWGTHWIVGTTDTDWELDRAHPAATGADIDYLLEQVNTVLAAPLTHDDIEGVYAGLRPLLSGRERGHQPAVARARRRPSRSRGWSRRRRQVHDLPGDGRGRRRRRRARTSAAGVAAASPTSIPLSGADGYRALCEPGRARSPRDAACRSGAVEHLLDRYGSLVRRAPRRSPTTTRAAASRCPGAEEYLAARGRVRRRRTRARCTSTTCSPGAPGSRSRPATAASTRAEPRPRLMAPVLGWDEGRIARRGRRTTAPGWRPSGSRSSEPDDLAADAARLAAPDIRARAVGRALD